MAQPKLKTNELAESINSLALRRRKPSPSEIARLKNELGKSITVRNAEYYDFLGRIAALENDKEKMIAYYKEAFTHSFNKNYSIYESYQVALSKCGLLAKENEQLKEIIRRFPKQAHLNHLLIKNCCYLCRFREALSLEYKTANFNKIEKYVSIFDNSNLSDDKAEKLCQLAYSVLEIKNLYYSISEIEIIDNCVLYTIYVDLPIEEIFEVNWELANVFAENDEDMRSDVLMFEYSSVDVLEEKEQHECLI